MYTFKKWKMKISSICKWWNNSQDVLIIFIFFIYTFYLSAINGDSITEGIMICGFLWVAFTLITFGLGTLALFIVIPLILRYIAPFVLVLILLVSIFDPKFYNNLDISFILIMSSYILYGAINIYCAYKETPLIMDFDM